MGFIHFGKKQKSLGKDIPFDSDKQIAVIKCSICTGEQVAGFKSKEDGHFRLQPENKEMAPIIVDSVAIVGKVVYMIRSF